MTQLRGLDSLCRPAPPQWLPVTSAS